MYFGPERKNNRLKEFDYSSSGFYFVTICTKNREKYFGEITDGKTILNEYGEIIQNNILGIPVHFPKSELLKYVIMPNHIHLVIKIKSFDKSVEDEFYTTVGDENFRPLQYDKNHKTNLSNIIKGFKIGCTSEIRKQFNDYKFAWQRSFYERIIRDENEYNKTIEYIENNPLKWELDVNHVE